MLSQANGQDELGLGEGRESVFLLSRSVGATQDITHLLLMGTDLAQMYLGMSLSRVTFAPD